YQFILMDIQMPEMDGIESAKLIRKTLGPKTPPIIALTAKSSEKDQELAYQAGITGYLTKPLNKEKLESALRNLFADTGA
ncbi:MAG: response regulator, partial [Verrucomicrobiota bacterium]